MNTPTGTEKLGTLLRAARDRLQAAGIEDAGLEAELLLRQALRKPGATLPTKAWLLPRLGRHADDALHAAFEALVERRLNREPNAYITGIREFFGLAFDVTPDVLVPRPETELLVAKALEWAYGRSPRPSPYPGPSAGSLQLMQASRRTRNDPVRVVDVGTGSGAIAIALARDLPAAIVVATDVSRRALAVARRNAARHGFAGRVSFRRGNLIEPVDTYVDLIVANLPYVPDDEWRELAPEVRDHEPSLALRGGEDGLDLIRSLLLQAPRYLSPGGAVCLEFGAGQKDALLGAVTAALPSASAVVFEDFAGIPRVLVAALPPR